MTILFKTTVILITLYLFKVIITCNNSLFTLAPTKFSVGLAVLLCLREEVRTGKREAGYILYLLPHGILATNYGIFILISGSTEDYGSYSTGDLKLVPSKGNGLQCHR